MSTPSAERIPNTRLIALREEAGLSQQDLADELNELAGREFGKHPNITKKTIGRWERGEVEWPQPFYRRLLATRFDCAVDELGFRRPGRVLGAEKATVRVEDIFRITPDTADVDPRVEESQEQWRFTRKQLGGLRRQLAVQAQSLYPDAQVEGLEGTGAISHPSWIPNQPIPLEKVVLDLSVDYPAPAVTGEEKESAAVRPLATADKRYARYSHAIRDLAAPRLFENRLCFRLVGVDWATPVVQFQFGVMGFFDSMDTNEALAHEMALAHVDSSGEISRASWRRLTFRKLIGDPFDLNQRPLMGAIGTLTIRGGESPCMVLHHRDGSRVAGGGSMVHLLPAGIFQPSSVLPESVANDFSIWRNIQREYAEELLGKPEYDGSGQPIDYANLEPFASMDRARLSGKMRLYCLGMTLDALTLSGDLLTVAVIDPDLYDEMFREAVDVNDEGAVAAKALPFEENTIRRLSESGQVSPGASAAIHLAWRHRKSLT